MQECRRIRGLDEYVGCQFHFESIGVYLAVFAKCGCFHVGRFDVRFSCTTKYLRRLQK